MKILAPEAVSLLGMMSGQPGDGFAAGNKAASQPVIYGVLAAVALLLLVGQIRLVRPRNRGFTMLFASITVVNTGYMLLSISTGLEMALWVNRLTYLGSVFLPLYMLMIILEVTDTRYPKGLRGALFSLALLIFLIAASPGILPVYYKEVSFAVINGVPKLVKVYGPLHPLYLVYLLGYFGAMIAIIVRASVKKTLEEPAHALILIVAVFVNIAVWFMEQHSDIDFEFLSVSYIITELFLLGVNAMVQENRRLKALVREKDEALHAKAMTRKTEKTAGISAEQMEYFVKGIERLTLTERVVYEAYLDGKTTKEILSELNIKENTLKFHNKNLYGKLGVTSRKQLMEVYRAMQAAKKSE